MPIAPPPQALSETAAGRRAARNWSANRTALDRTQPAVAAALDGVDPGVEWTFGRDGSLTGRTADGRWWADCSVPDRTGRAVLASVAASPAVHCLLAPEHAGILTAARERVGPTTPVVVVHPDARAVRVLLAATDVADAIAAGRLWFALGDGWADGLGELFRSRPGLATPSQFVRTPLAADTEVMPLIERAQGVFAAVTEGRTAVLRAIRSGWADRRPAGPAVVLCRSGYTLWEGGPSMLGATCGPGFVRFDTDDPLNTSPVALATAAATCGGVVAADAGRSTGAGSVRSDVPWITLLTRRVIPDAAARDPLDSLILPTAVWRPVAEQAGWPADRVHVAGWPAARLPPAVGSPHLALLADTRPIAAPAAVADYSSHRVLWEAIESELASSPLAAADAARYLSDRAGQVGVDLETLDVATFLDQLICPAFQQGVARTLISAGVPVRLWGAGWTDLDDLAEYAAGPVESMVARDRAAGAAVGLVHCWPENEPHPIQRMGRPVLRAASGDARRLIDGARQMILGHGRIEPTPMAEPFWDVVRHVLSHG